MQTIYMRYCLKFRNFSVTKMIAKCSNKLDAAIKTPLGCCKLQVTKQSLSLYRDTKLDQIITE